MFFKKFRSGFILLAIPYAACGDTGERRGSVAQLLEFTDSHFGESPYDPPEANDGSFVIDQSHDLDTPCRFRSSGPIEFQVTVDRVVGDVQRLKERGLISEFARLSLPAYDVDFDYGERDRVFFNGNVVTEEYLTGSNGEWKLNAFRIPIEWVNFPSDPGRGGQAATVANTIRIEIDVANSQDTWCTSIDWAVFEFEVVRPVVFAHGMLSSSAVWNHQWVPRMTLWGVPTDPGPDMGDMDSIPNNAAKIAGIVESLLHRWGVDRVNIVAHGKGGIDARHFAEQSNAVDQLVQLGAPNAGSRVVDATQAGDLTFEGPPNFNLLSDPVAAHLTTNSMVSHYNPYHGANPQVRYTSVAGAYDPACPGAECQKKEQWLLSFSVENEGDASDTIVSVKSAHALDYADKLLDTSSGFDKSATHECDFTGRMCLYKSVDAFDVASEPLMRFGRPIKVSAAEQLVTAANIFLDEAVDVAQRPYLPTATASGELAVGVPRSHAIAIDEGHPLFISLMHPGGDIRFELVSPSGRHIDPAVADQDPSIDSDSGPMLGGYAAVYAFDAPEVGLWTAIVEARELPISPANYVINAWTESPTTRLSANVSRSSISQGQFFDLYGSVYEGSGPAIGASLQARIALPDGTAYDVNLRDDGVGSDVVAGDGTYSARFSATAVAGVYRILFSANGSTSQGMEFSRQELAVVTVSASSSTFTGVFRDLSRDLNGDGLFDQLIIAADLDIQLPATYRVYGLLVDDAGHMHESSTTVTLDRDATVELIFDGEALFHTRMNGPYTLVRVGLVEEHGLPITDVIYAHRTAAYRYYDFQHDPILLNGEGRAQGIDTDQNERYNILAVLVGVELRYGGHYRWSARLADRYGKELGFDAGSATFSPGVNQLTFAFDGQAIGINGVDGPYTVSSLLVDGAGESLVVTGEAFATPAFNSNEFENGGPVAVCRDASQCTEPGVCTAVIDDLGAGSYHPGGNSLSIAQSPPGPYSVGLQQVEVHVSDGVRSDMCLASVEVFDCEAPSIVCPDDFLVECTANGEAPITSPAASATDNCQASLSSPEAGSFSLGQHTLVYTARDTSGNTSSCSTAVTVQDTFPPDITCPAPIVAECTGSSTAHVIPGQAISSDTCTDVTIQGPNPGPYPLGTTVVTYTSTDFTGNQNHCNSSIEVVDTTAPQVSVTPPSPLWPPNHGYHTVNLEDCMVVVDDRCDGILSPNATWPTITCVTSDEVDDAPNDGDGRTINDIVIHDARTVALRAERQGRGDGRFYNIHFRVMDAAGNEAFGVCPVTVPHDRSGEASVDSGARQTICSQ